MDELAKRRFEHLAGRIAVELQAFKEAEKHLIGSAVALQTLLKAQLDAYERVHTNSAEITRLREELKATWGIITDPQTLPALEAAHLHFDDIAIEIAKLVGALP